jgi:hypothetical protein
MTRLFHLNQEQRGDLAATAPVKSSDSEPYPDVNYQFRRACAGIVATSQEFMFSYCCDSMTILLGVRVQDVQERAFNANSHP